MRNIKSACKINDVYEGFAHILEGFYDDCFSVRYGRVWLSCASVDVAILMTRQEVQLQLPDGRSMIVRLLRPHPVFDEGRVEFYFVSTTPLVNLASLFDGVHAESVPA